MLGHSISPQKTIWGHMAPGSFLFSNYRKVIYVVNPIDDYDNHWFVVEILGDYPNFTQAIIKYVL